MAMQNPRVPNHVPVTEPAGEPPGYRWVDLDVELPLRAQSLGTLAYDLLCRVLEHIARVCQVVPQGNPVYRWAAARYCHHWALDFNRWVGVLLEQDERAARSGHAPGTRP